MTNSESDYAGVTAEMVRAASDAFYGPDDPRLDRALWDRYDVAVLAGIVRNRLRGLADALEDDGTTIDPFGLRVTARNVDRDRDRDRH
jgi:hypothetical protein